LSGKTDNPAALLPMLNELRQQRGDSMLESSDFFHPNMAVKPPPREHELPNGVDSVLAATKLHRFFMSSLAKVLKAVGVPGYLNILGSVVGKLYDIASSDDWRRLLWVATAFVEALGDKSIKLSQESKPLLAKLEQQIKRVASNGEDGLDNEVAEKLLYSMLFQLARSNATGKKATEIRQAFSLAGFEAEEFGGGVSGLSSEVKQTVSADIMEELSQVKDAFDVFVRSDRSNPQSLEPLVGSLGRIAETLSLLQEYQLREALIQQVEVIRQLIAGDAECNDDTLMGVAGAILSVESALSDWGTTMPVVKADASEEQVADAENSPQAIAEHQRVTRQVMQESKEDLVKVREAINGYLDNTQEKELLARIPQMLHQIVGSLSMLSYKRVAQVLSSTRAFIEAEMIGKDTLPEQEKLDALADSIMSVEYYLEAFINSRVHPGSVLDVAENAVALLGYPIGTVVEALPAEESEAPALGGIEVVESAEEVPASAEASPAPTAASVSAPAESEIDDEIREIFIEEAEEVLENVKQLLPAWLNDPADEHSLKELRRNFHTLKGSGRMAGAAELGEFSWSIENMLNHVIDGTIQSSAVMADLLQQSNELLPELLEQFRSGTPPQGDVATLQEMAFALAEPGAAPPTPAAAPAAVAEAAPAEVPAVAEEIPQMDPALLEIYAKEADGHLQEIEAYIDEWRGGGSHKVSEPLVRALHTLKGSSRMAGVMSIASVCEQLEKYAKTLQANHQGVDEQGVDALQAADEYTRAMIGFMVDGQTGEQPEATQAMEMAHAVYADVQHLEHIADAQPEAGLAGSEEIVSGAIEELEQIAEELPEAEESITLEPLPETVPETEPAAEIVVEEVPAPAPSAGEVEEEYDTELLDIFLEEGADILDSSEETLQAWVDNPDDRGLVESLQRQLHTLKGGARMAGIMPIGDLSHSLESTFEAVVEGQLQRTPQMMDLLQLSHDRLVTMLEQVRNHEPVTPADDLIRKVAVLGHAPAAEAEEEGAAAAVEHISAGEFELAISEVELNHGNWLRDIDEKAAFNELYKSAISLADLCGRSGSAELGGIASALERVLAAIMDGHVPVSKKAGDLISHVLDLTRRIHTQYAQGLPLSDGQSLIADVDELITRSLAEEALDAAVISSDELSKEKEAEQQQSLAEEVKWKRDKPEAEAGDKRQAPRIQHEMVRIRSDLLDNLVNYAGEVSIYRSRVEQQIGSFRSNIGEMDRTVERLHEQVRAFEIENEAQIESRREETMKVQEDFDPLELDRFTHMQQLSRSMAESLNDLLSIEDLLSGLVRESETLLVQQSRVNTELQENLMHTRMVPLVENAPRLRRIVRQTASELGKRATLKFKGAEVEMDRNVVERMMAPLEHMIRNSIAHGIESGEERGKVGKPDEGTITIALAREGSEIVIQVSDDGAGIDVEVVRKKAVARGMMKEDAVLSDKDVIRFILESGFSTAQSLSQIAGRGVGMDVVNSEIKQLGGVLEIDTVPGTGTTFTMRIPITLSVSRALLVHVAADTYAIPLLSVSGIERVETAELERLLASEDPTMTWLGEEYDLMHLTKILGIGPGSLNKDLPRQPLLLARSGQHRIAFAVDHLLGSREIVVKSLGSQLSTLQDIAGATILADGNVALIIDMPSLIRRGLAHKSRAEVVEISVPETSIQEPLIMVVDDSITVRKVTERLLKRHNMRCITARDGIDALSVLEENIPDVMLLDIEMPRMDGFELATHMRNSDRFKDIPIIMITSRTGEKHRQRALDIGVNKYMGKPYTEVDLLENIESLVNKS